MEDLLILNGLIVDGTGGAPYSGGVSVKDGMITEVGEVSGTDALKVIDAEGKVISPGFIDTHGHSDEIYMTDDRCEAKIYQGITTEVCGMCGDSPFPSKEYAGFSELLSKTAPLKMSTNLCQFVGHGTIRSSVMGFDDRIASPDELEKMRSILDRELQAGAWGLSLGLEYTPGCFSDRAELVSLGETVKKHDALLTAHMRNEGLYIEDAIREVAEIGRHSGAKLEISHLKIDNNTRWGDAPEIWQLIEDLRSEGISINADMYLYDCSSTGITTRCPKWAIEGGIAMAAAHLRGERRDEVLDCLKTRFPDREWAERCIISDTCGCLPEFEGKTLADFADSLNTDYYLAAAELILRTEGEANCLFRVMDENDIRYFMSKDVTICSDGYGYSLDPAITTTKPHPRSFGSHVKFLRLAREENLFSLEAAVHRITGKSALNIGITDRGFLKPGMAADITVFDPETVSDTAKYTDPLRKPVGIHHVIVNGKVEVEDGIQTSERSGKYLIHRPARG